MFLWIYPFRFNISISIHFWEKGVGSLKKNYRLHVIFKIPRRMALVYACRQLIQPALRIFSALVLSTSFNRRNTWLKEWSLASVGQISFHQRFEGRGGVWIRVKWNVSSNGIESAKKSPRVPLQCQSEINIQSSFRVILISLGRNVVSSDEWSDSK